MKRLRVGLTGGLASGKSTLAGWFKEAGFHVIDADQTVAELYRPGEPGSECVEHLFGPGFLNPDGSVNRDKLAGLVFSDAQALLKLETGIHPLVREKVLRWIHNREGVTVVEATLLVESGIASELDIIITVSADETLRSQRAINRGLSPHQVESRLAAQGDDRFREAAADTVIVNNGSLDEFRQRANEVISEFKQQMDQCSGADAEDQPIMLVTSNRGKLREARSLFGGPLMSADIDLPEIQSLDIDEILRTKARTAWGRIERPLIVEETSLELAGMNRFPGPLIKWMLKAMGGPGIARLAIATGNPNATARCRLLYRDDSRRLAAEGTCTGTMVMPRGSKGFGWDPVFQPDRSDHTFAEMPTEAKSAISHRGKAWRELERILRAEGIV